MSALKNTMTMLDRFIRKLIENNIDTFLRFAFYIMFIIFLPFSSIKWFYLMIAISVISFLLTIAHLYIDYKKNDKTKIKFWLTNTDVVNIAPHICIYIYLLISPAEELYHQV